MIGRSMNWLVIPALTLTACGAPGPGDTVEDFLRAIERADLVRAETLLAADDGGGTMRRHLFGGRFGGLRPSGLSRIDILSENVEDGDPVRANVEARITFDGPYGSLQRDYAYRLEMENGRYKIAEEEMMEWPPPASRGSGSGPSDDSGPGGAVVEYLRAIEQGDVARVDDVTYLATSDDGSPLNEMLFDEFFNMVYEVNEYGLDFTILSEEVYEGSTGQARVQVMHNEHGGPGRIPDPLNPDSPSFPGPRDYTGENVPTVGLVMEDGIWKIATWDSAPQGVAGPSYPVVNTIAGRDATVLFVNGGSPIGDIELARNCGPSGKVLEVLYSIFDFEGGTLFRDGSYNPAPVGSSILNRYFQCIGLEQFEEPEVFGCSSISALFRYLEMFHPNHPSPDRARWSEMDADLYSSLFDLGAYIVFMDELGHMRSLYGNRWILCKELALAL